ncbi:MAG: hypothetical protein ACFE89_10600 [Candidatus Hodarchaeota archaeon]
MPRLAYWDQEDHDKAMFQIRQPRQVVLSLSFEAKGVPFAKKRVRVYVARSMVEGCDEFHEYILNDEGDLELSQHYGESLIDVELHQEALPPDCGIDYITFHWYHPGQWFDQLSIHQDLTKWRVNPPNTKNGDITFDVTFDPALRPTSAQVNFSNLLGYIFEAPEMGSYPEATVKIRGKGQATFIIHMHRFFEKWAKNYQTPFQAGDEYPLELILTFDTAFDVKPSSKKDPVFVPKSYDGRVDQADGNPYLGVPSTTPEHSTQLVIKPKVTLTSQMLPKP